MVDQSTITGEPLPVDKTVGDEVFTGPFTDTGSLRIQVYPKRVLRGLVLSFLRSLAETLLAMDFIETVTLEVPR